MSISRKRFLGALAVAAMFTAPSAFAVEPGTYVTLGAGFGNAMEANIAVPGSDYEADEIGDSVVFAGSFGHRFSPNLRAEVELSYHPDYAVDERLTAAGTMVDIDAEISAMSAMANVYYDFPMQRFTPFIGIGAGMSRNELFDIRNTALDGPYAGLSVIGHGDRTTEFAWQAILGSEVAINDNLSLELAYHYADLGKLTTAANSSGGVTTPPGEGELRMHDFRVGLRYTF